MLTSHRDGMALIRLRASAATRWLANGSTRIPSSVCTSRGAAARRGSTWLNSGSH
jgi:hypothetical protein